MAGLIGWPELILILIIVVFIFGASRLREMGKAVGEGVREYKKATAETPEQIKKEDAIREAAEKMGISTEGKTTSQLLEEMSRKSE